MNNNLSSLSKILCRLDAIIFDFDGVFTDNNVYTSCDGVEFVRCSKSDSLGLDIFKKYILEKNI